MGLDASIYSQVGKYKTFRDYENEDNAAQVNKLQLLAAQQGYDQQKQGIADQNALRAATQGFGADETANYNALLRTGNMDAAQKYKKGNLDARKTEGDIGKTKAETGKYDAETKAKTLDASIKAHDFHVQQLGAIQSPEQVPAWIQSGVDSGIFPADQMPAMMQRFQQAVAQPGGFEQWKQASLQGGSSATEQLKMAQAKLIADNSNATSRANNADTNATSRANNGATNAVSMRGQNMTDARSRESNVATMTKPFEVTGPDGAPMLVRQDKQGNITPVQGYGPKAGTAKPLTEAQAKDLGYGTRMQVADKVIGDMTGKFSPGAISAKNAAEGVPLVGGLLGMGANAMMSGESQQVEQAQRDFINAVLRRESGAAISPSEFDNYRKQYFPQVNDKPGNLAQKAANRKLAMEGVMASVPKGQRGSIGPTDAAPTGDIHAQADAILRGGR